jgi:hypothetical protein
LPLAAPKDARREATRRRIAGTAEERTAWGNLGDAQPEGLEDAAAGQPGDAKPAQPEDRGTGKPGTWVTRLDGTIDDPMSCKGTQKKAPETPVSGAFKFLRAIQD